jgi:hypothetical protein
LLDVADPVLERAGAEALDLLDLEVAAGAAGDEHGVGRRVDAVVRTVLVDADHAGPAAPGADGVVGFLSGGVVGGHGFSVRDPRSGVPSTRAFPTQVTPRGAGLSLLRNTTPALINVAIVNSICL